MTWRWHDVGELGWKGSVRPLIPGGHWRDDDDETMLDDMRLPRLQLRPSGSVFVLLYMYEPSSFLGANVDVVIKQLSKRHLEFDDRITSSLHCH